ncbi:MAG: cytosine permease [Peptoniphilaceae bacterium]|nr:cytosine permease [Peptoniphilaceae bacterium]
MPWLPLISDYTREAKDKKGTSLTSAVVYTLVSIWMYVIGLGMALITEESDIGLIMLNSGLGIIAILIIILSTVTTTFLDAYSAGISFESLTNKVAGKNVALVVTIIGIVGAMLFPMDDITDFLYFIGSVFAPMVAVQIIDFFILGKRNIDNAFHSKNLIVWLVGFVTYRIFLKLDLILGSTISCIIVVVLVKVLTEKILQK